MSCGKVCVRSPSFLLRTSFQKPLLTSSFASSFHRQLVLPQENLWSIRGVRHKPRSCFQELWISIQSLKATTPIRGAKSGEKEYTRLASPSATAQANAASWIAIARSGASSGQWRPQPDPSGDAVSRRGSASSGVVQQGSRCCGVVICPAHPRAELGSRRGMVMQSSAHPPGGPAGGAAPPVNQHASLVGEKEGGRGGTKGEGLTGGTTGWEKSSRLGQILSIPGQRSTGWKDSRGQLAFPHPGFVLPGATWILCDGIGEPER